MRPPVSIFLTREHVQIEIKTYAASPEDYNPEHKTHFIIRDIESGYNVTLNASIIPRKEKARKPIRSRETGSTTPAEDRAKQWQKDVASQKRGVIARIELAEKLQPHGPIGGNKLTPLNRNVSYSWAETRCEGNIDGVDTAWIDSMLREASRKLESLDQDQRWADEALAKATRQREEAAWK